MVKQHAHAHPYVCFTVKMLIEIRCFFFLSFLVEIFKFSEFRAARQNKIEQKRTVCSNEQLCALDPDNFLLVKYFRAMFLVFIIASVLNI